MTTPRVSDVTLSFDSMRIRGHRGSYMQGSSLKDTTVELVGGLLFLFGRQYVSRDHLGMAVVGIVDLSTQRWREGIEYFGVHLRNPRLFLYEDALYAYTVSNPLDFDCAGLCKLDICLKEWSKCNQTGDGPNRLETCAASYVEYHERFVVYNKVLRAVNGTVVQNTNTIHLLAMPAFKWITPKMKGTPPDARPDCSCVHQGRIYYYGQYGYDRLQNPLQGIFILKHSFERTETVTWSSIQLTTLRCDRASMLPLNGKLMLYGGGSEAHGVWGYNAQQESFETVQLSDEDNDLVKSSGAPFTLHAGHAFGVITGTPQKPNLVLITQRA